MKTLKESFRMPTPVKITGRSSSITNSFVNSIIPVISPTEAQISRALDILEISHTDMTCAYCGDRSTEWDHLNPLVANKQATGFISEIENLVPACGKCNQSKGNKPWRDWMVSGARLSPKTRRIADIDRRIKILGEYEKRNKPSQFDFRSVVGSEKWDAYWEDWHKVQDAMKDAQCLAEEIRLAVHKAAKDKPQSPLEGKG
jgi:hypothetical protein